MIIVRNRIECFSKKKRGISFESQPVSVIFERLDNDIAPYVVDLPLEWLIFFTVLNSNVHEILSIFV